MEHRDSEVTGSDWNFSFVSSSENLSTCIFTYYSVLPVFTASGVALDETQMLIALVVNYWQAFAFDFQLLKNLVLDARASVTLHSL